MRLSDQSRRSHRQAEEPPHPFDPDWCLCPGDAIRRFVEGDGDDEPVLPSHEEVQALLGINDEEYRQLLRGELHLGDDMADALGEYMGMSHGQPDSFWRNFERIYREALACGKTHVCHPDGKGVKGPHVDLAILDEVDDE